MPDLTKLQFYSGNNYLKRSQFWGQTNATIPSGESAATVTINHNLGIIPQYVVAIDYQNNGIWWATEFVGSIREGGRNDDTPTITVMVDTSNLYIIGDKNYSGTIISTTRPIKYGIYLDS